MKSLYGGEDSDDSFDAIEVVNQLRVKRKKKAPCIKKNSNFGNLALKSVSPLTEAQRQLFFSSKAGFNVIADGAAGSGKTYGATYLALERLFNNEIDKVVFVRSAVNIRSQGHLPGTQDEKEAVYTIPFKEIVNDLCENGTAWDILVKKDLIKFLTTTYIRGITLKNCVVIIDESQNMDIGEMESVLTRLGDNASVIICGDTRQCDLTRKRENSCHDWLLKIASNMPDYFDIVTFMYSDIVRSDFVKQLIITIDTVE